MQTTNTPYAKRSIPAVGVIVAVGVALTALVLMFGRGGSAVESGGEPGALTYPRGPHGARLLSDGALQLEVTIYETGVEPQFRVYTYDANLEPVAPADVQLRIELHRLGGRVDLHEFKPEADYLLGDAVVEEPHSFDVKVFAQAGGRSYEWSYSQIEGKVKLTEDQLKSSGITIETVAPRRMITTVTLPGQVTADETRLAHVVARMPGVVAEVFKQEGDVVRKGDVLAVIESRELAAAKTAFVAAEHHREFLGTALAREESLWQKKIAAERDYLEARRHYDEALLNERLAAQSLIVLGIPRESLEGLASAPAESMARFEIRAPLDGRIIARNAAVGEAVPADERLFTVADLSTVWVDITVYAKDLAMVREGQAATIRSTDLGAEVTGCVAFVSPLVGEATRAAKARIVLANPRGTWRPGLFVNVELVRETTVVKLAVTTEGIQTFRDWQVVFVRFGDWFEARPLKLGRSDGTYIEVLEGLRPGERYAATNSFAIKAEIGKLGATHDH
ncbi:MAG: efflux RND transporter periplasmic adaptor subunit [Gemmatimonadetes bacterium]|nr:efflux RND transporter periplasmic adaptor subunit [Gemmatimonadota bacterium]